MTDASDRNRDLVAYERRLLRASATRGAVPVADPELGQVLARVAERRRRRTAGGEGPGPTMPATRDAHVAGPPGTVLAVHQPAPEVRILRIARPSGLTFRAGQYVKAGVPGGRRRSFSVASAPSDPDLELCVELRPGGQVTPALFALAPGDRVEVDERARGGMALDESAAHHLLVATVTGIAPLRSMLREARHRGLEARFTVLHGASHADQLPFADELAALAAADERVAYLPTVSRPDDPRNRAWRGRGGRVDPLAVEVAASLDPASTHVYVAGHPEMVANVARALGSAGFAVSTEPYD